MQSQRVEAHAALVVEIVSRPDAATLRAWDRLVSDTPQSDVAQLSAWADVRRAAGFAPLYLLARAGTELVGGALVLHRLPAPGPDAVAYVPFGPVLPEGELRAEAAERICEALVAVARERFSALFVQPMATGSDVRERLLRRGFRPSTVGTGPDAVAVDLTTPLDRLRAGLDAATRDDITRARAAGVRVRRGGLRDLPVVAALLRETAERAGRTAPSAQYLRVLHRALVPGGHVHVFLAEVDGVGVAADVVTTSGGVPRVRMSGMRHDDARRLGADALVRWEAMLWARAQDHDTFDLGETDADDAARFGGQAVRRPSAVELLAPTGPHLAQVPPRAAATVRQLTAAAGRFLRGVRATPAVPAAVAAAAR